MDAEFSEVALPSFVAEFADDVHLDKSGSVLITADGQEMILRRPPAGIDPQDELGGQSLAAIRAVCQHAKDCRKIQSDLRMSDLGKAEKRLPIDVTAVRAIATAHDAVERQAAAAESASAAFYAVPHVEPNDSANAIMDQEIRAYLRSLPESAREHLPAVLAANPRMLAAHLRAPYLTGLESFDTMAKRLWTDSRDTADPEGSARLRQRREVAEWGRRVVKQTANAITKRVKLPASEIFARLNADNLGAASSLFGITTRDVLSFRRAA